MPKKTKRQKIAAQLHKQHISYQAVELKSEPEENKIIAEPIKLKPTKALAIFETSTVVFRADLKKSIIISLVLLLLEIGIYIGQTNGMSLNTILPF